jgi:uncharacterized lipoprotein YddW (UPF0748 family)
VRTTLTSPESIARMVADAKAGGFNTLIVQVRGRGDAYYGGSVEPRPPSLAATPAFDPLATTIARAHDAGLKVHAWININLVGGLDLPASRDHIVYRHPDWLMVPAALAQDLARLDVKSGEYVSRLARYARTRPTDVEGVYLSPVTQASADYTTAIVRAITRLYPVDGIHLDYIRYPGEDFDYGRQTLSAFRQSIVSTLTSDERRRLDARLASDPLIYTRTFPDSWHSFRTSRLTELVSQIRTAVKAARPGAVISAAVAPDPAVAAAHRLQDWRGWLSRNLIDVVCPMAYTQDAATFASQMIAARQAAGAHPIWAGIGAYRLTPVQIADNVQTARRLGADGVILFSYDSLTEPSRGPGYLGQVARAAFTNQ